tara:strand:- start:1960 stop:2097 length:138 start_codon:yes stop_codon:yes gene_type:complete
VGKVKIRITLTRYQRDKLFGKQYRDDTAFTGSFTEYKKKKKKESK